MLTGNTKEAFEKWYRKSAYQDAVIFYEQFKRLSFNMQWGVYLEFFDSKGITISTSHVIDGRTQLRIWRKLTLNDFASKYPTRQQAQIEAIKKASMIREMQIVGPMASKAATDLRNKQLKDSDSEDPEE